ncbi:MAG: methylenetetrahydrofolate reductase [NAD(P)H] [Ruminiclostridium sp.]|nr:methylenetetrahydrofolate reductase [NAD(P)H] [Ruminiclostridium sp.]
MKISEMFKTGKPVLSFEVFPPKKTSGVESITAAVDELAELKPAYISVTYGAGGNTANTFTRDIAAHIKNDCGIEAMAHITCVNNSKEEVLTVMDSFTEAGIENILALRGDINPNVPPKTDFSHASDMITFIRSHSKYDNIGISGACYPEGHTEAESLTEDIINLREKVNAGAEELISQLFFDNAFFYDFREKAKIAGINIPISAGIMPVTSKSQIERMVTMCGASLPQKFVRMVTKYESRPDALIDAGIAYAADQIADLLSSGVDGIHLYTMNNPYVARKIVDMIGKLL